uniref:Uncharacterized protein n=1 Tax=Glossina austeni TaxID=7395 RepID=A0A1A9UTE8_GLOAU
MTKLVEMARIRRDDSPAEGDSGKIDFSEFANKIVDEFKKTLNNEDLQNFFKNAQTNLQEVTKSVSESVSNALNNMKKEST